MKILSWNIQGGCKPQALAELLFWNSTIKPDIMFILETRTLERNSNKILKALRFDHKIVIEPINHAGGIWVVWNNSEFKIEHVKYNNRCCHMWISNPKFPSNFVVTGTYAPAQDRDKEAYWEYITQFHRNLAIPWMLIGDLNELLDPTDKIGGRQINLQNCKRLMNFLEVTGGVDAPTSNQPFSWKRIINNEIIFEKLDRAIFSEKFMDLFPTSITKYENFSISDHAPITFLGNTNRNKNKYLFRFLSGWAIEKEPEKFVEEIWKMNVKGSRFFRILHKNRQIKCKLKDWAKNHCKFSQNKLIQNQDRITQLESKLIEQPLNKVLQAHLERLIKQREKLLLYGHRTIQNSNRQKWLNQGDRNTRYFHMIMKQRQAHRACFRLKNELGLWIHDTEEIKELFLNSFKNRFRSTHISERSLEIPSFEELSTDDRNTLLKPVSEDEVINSFLAMDPNKSPGSDGFGPLFYQKYWHIIGKEVTLAIQSFFYHGKITPAISHTLIALIPKRECPDNPNHYRPISLVNTIYKAITKIIVHRMGPIMKKIISPFQNAFTNGRSIHDNLLIVQEILHTFYKSKSKVGWCALKLDMEKAYDRVEWDFLKATLFTFGFPNHWINLIMECVTSTSYSLIVNGETTEFFKPTRGLKQGDPLSPYLFLLCMEIFTRQLTSNGIIKKPEIGVAVGRASIRIPALIFADDMLLFCKASSTACSNMKSLIDNFCAYSGQLINYHKSALIFSKHVPIQKRNNLAGLLNVSPNTTLGRYLGVKFDMTKPCKNDMGSLLSKVESRISQWGSKFLSKAGRHTLIQSNLESIPAYSYGAFLIPPKLGKQLDAANRKFFWNTGQNSSSLPLIAWDKVCAPKTNGGLGLRKTTYINKAYLAKWGWKVLTDPENIWVKIVEAKYLKGNSFLNYKANSGDSTIWKSILKQRDIIRRGTRWKVGNGKSIKFWEDRWLDERSLIEILSININSIDRNLRVADFINVERQWDMMRLTTTIPLELALAIKGIPIPIADVEDQPIWGLTSNGNFSVKSATWLTQGISCSTPPWPWGWIWKIDIPPKLQIFLWQGCHNSLPVRSILFNRKIIDSNVCPLCNVEEESIDHLFFQCEVTKSYWNFIQNFNHPINIRTITTFHQCLNTLKNQPHDLTNIIFSLWSIWKERNQTIFQNIKFDNHRTRCRAFSQATEWKHRTILDNSLSNTKLAPYTNTTKTSISKPFLVGWTPPNQTTIKLNFDGSVKGKSAAAGYILRNSQGDLISAEAFNLGNCPVYVAEAVGLQKGIIQAIRMNIPNIIIEGDNLLVVNSVKGNWEAPWKLDFLIKEIRQLLNTFDNWSIKHIYREANQAADWIADIGHIISDRMTVSCMNHSKLKEIVCNDALGMTFVRKDS